jgi:SNF2 family DNA or RNA helicase
VLCPPSVRAVWRREIAKHSKREIDALILDTGSVRQRTNQAIRAVWKWRRPSIIVINYEAVWREPFCRLALEGPWDLVICDESHKLQREGVTARFVAKLRESAARRLCLTGTPLTQDPLAVFAQARFLDPTVFGENYEAFKWWYYNPEDLKKRKDNVRINAICAKNGWEPVYVEEAYMCGVLLPTQYLAALSRIAFRVENAVLSLPPLLTEQRTFALSQRARTLYTMIQDGHGADIMEGPWGEKGGSYATTMRLQEITSGWLPDESGNPVTIDQGKADALRDLLREAGGEPVVVFCRFVRDLDTVRETAGRLGLVYGEISHRRKDGVSALGTMPAGLDVVGVQPQAGGAGIDLTRARIAVFFSPSWSLAEYDQAVARVHRPPATRPVIIYHLVAEGTIDEEIYLALRSRRDLVGQIWRDLGTASAPVQARPGGTGCFVTTLQRRPI